MLVYEQQGTITPSAGTANVSLTFSAGEAKILVITSATSTTTFDVKLINTFNAEVFRSENCTGTLVENMSIPIRGNATLTIYNASANELFTYYLGTIERYA